jgi:mannose-6-phosphate isomerase-like protein (cupin superfamily)
VNHGLVTPRRYMHSTRAVALRRPPRSRVPKKMPPVPVVKLPTDVVPALDAATGLSFALREWSGSGPEELHIHHEDDEAWHVLAGALRFRFLDGEVDAPAGSTVFVPAGVAHTFAARTQETRYLIILTSRLLALIQSLDSNQSRAAREEIYRAHASEILG